jgi:Holliday junction resolvasome RuvABC ATP-dependent DNA helicase subunit
MPLGIPFFRLTGEIARAERKEEVMTTSQIQGFYVFGDASARRAACTRCITPFNDYVGQDGAVERLLDLAYQAYSNPYHLVEENVMLAGPPSTGKTTVVKMLVKMLGTPSVITNSNQVSAGISIAGNNVSGGPDTIIHLILDAWAKERKPLSGVQAGNFAVYELPPMTVFIDEIHGLKRKTADALLQATERADGMLFGRDAVMDCKKVLWIGATTDWGKLPPAFRTRFMRIDLEPPTPEDVARIVSNNTKWDINTSRKIVFYGSIVPREALAFARTVERYAKRAGGHPADCIWACAQREGIDQWGMKRQRVDILKVLASNQSGLILRNLSSAINCESDEVVKYWLPPLLFSKPPLVMVERGAYLLTETGRSELSKRGFST